MPNFTTKSSHVSQPERFCKYIHRYCNQTRLDGYDYCIRHILEDKTAPFRQCMYVNQPNKKRCTNAAPKTDKNDRRDNTLCPFHAKRALMKTRVYHSKRKPALEGPAALLRSLEHYCEDPVHDPSYNQSSGTSERHSVVVCDPGKPSTIEQLQASFENDGEPVLSKAHVESVDDDFCYVEKTNCLDHAGVYTHKEVCTMAREKLLRLQHLYCVELKVLYHDFKEAKRKYLQMARHPFPETDGQKSPKLVYRDLKDVRGRIVAKIEKPSTSEADPATSYIDNKVQASWKQYHRRSGIERIFRRRVLERRAGLPKPAKPACAFEKNGLKCPEPAIVSTSYCKTHILNDPNQVLFVACGLSRNCPQPVLPIEDDPACDQHFSFSSPGQPAPEELFVVQQPVVLQQQQPVASTSDLLLDPEHFQSMDDIASLGLDAITPGSLFGLDQFGEPGESTDTVLSEDQTDLMQIQAITLNPPSDILSDTRKSDSE